MTEKNGRIPPFGGKRSCLEKVSGYNTEEEGCGSRHSLIGNDKNSVIANKVLSYF